MSMMNQQTPKCWSQVKPTESWRETRRTQLNIFDNVDKRQNETIPVLVNIQKLIKETMDLTMKVTYYTNIN